MTTAIENIIVKYLNREASATELESLEEWLKDDAHLELFKSYIRTNHLIDSNVIKFDTISSKEKLLALISKEDKVIKMRTYYRVSAYAAVLAVLMAIGFLFKNELFLRDNQDSNIQTKVVENNIKVGTDKATLTLEDGSQVVLNKGTSYQTSYVESNGEALVYENSKLQSTEPVYNLLTVPRGGQFFVQLADGTKVWLNSESQLRYPRNFIDGKPRAVELVYGEAYFDVSPSTAHNGSGFQVAHKGQEINVLGTEFNIKAYQEESKIYTTLVEGKVLVSNTGKERVLKPNQQYTYNLLDSSYSVSDVIVYNEISWKNGVFSFENKSLKEIMTVLSRWYDMNVEFENDAIEKEEFIGVLYKNRSIERILKNIKSVGAINNYEINDKKVILK